MWNWLLKALKDLKQKYRLHPFISGISEPKDIWYGLVIRSQALAVYNNGLEDIRCRGTWLDQETYIWVYDYGFYKNKGYIDLNHKTLISEMIISGEVRATHNGEKVKTKPFPNVLSVSTNKDLTFGNVKITNNQCWRGHTGTYVIEINIRYNGKDYVYKTDNYEWRGDGEGINIEHVDTWNGN
ncbi:hypothetical protein NGB58_26535 [Escherichia coli]|nr:hypothetical protein [Escherichia coli]